MMSTRIDAISALYESADQPDENVSSYLDSMLESQTMVSSCMEKLIKGSSPQSDNASQAFGKLSQSLDKALKKLKEAYKIICDRAKASEQEAQAVSQVEIDKLKKRLE